jgi:hypothetical protein
MSAMLDAFDVVMPALKERVRGSLRPVFGGKYGAVLLDTAQANGPFLAALYDELELYFQGAGVTTLRLMGQHERGVAHRTRELLASVMLLRSIGVEQVILIVSADTPLPDPSQVATATMADFLRIVAERGQTLPDVFQAVRSLIAGIRVVADSVIGVATLVSADASQHDRDTRRKRPPLQLVRSGDDEAATSPFATEAMPPVLARPTLLLRVPDLADAAQSRRRAELLARLYNWVTAEAETRTSARVSRADASIEASFDGWHSRLVWLEERWREICEAALTRAPARGAELHEFIHPERHGNTLHAARDAWPYLDSQARLEWLWACAHVFSAQRHDRMSNVAPLRGDTTSVS